MKRESRTGRVVGGDLVTVWPLDDDELALGSSPGPGSGFSHHKVRLPGLTCVCGCGVPMLFLAKSGMKSIFDPDVESIFDPDVESRAIAGEGKEVALGTPELRLACVVTGICWQTLVA